MTFTALPDSSEYCRGGVVNMVSRMVVGRRCIPNRGIQRTEVKGFNARANRNKTVIHWGFSKMDARREFGYECTFRRPGD